jgi:RNA polymerase sigma-70 factor (ECF subfamily)
MEQARAGDREAFAVFYRRYSALVMAFLYRRTLDPEQAADLMAEVFASALVSVRRDGPLPDDPAAWIFGVAKNRLADARRRGVIEAKARAQLRMDALQVTERDVAEIVELADDGVVNSLLAGLPPAQRQAVRARVFDDRDYADIAQELQTSHLVVRKRVSRGLAAVKARMEQAQR